MSYTQFGYTYPTSSQILMTGNHPATATPCCQPASPVEAYSGSGAAQPAAQAAVCSLPAAYDSRLLSSFPRLAGLYAASSATSYAAAADPQGYVTAALAGTNPPAAFYSSLPNPYDLKESRGAWAPLPQGATTACYPYDPTGLAAYGPYGDRYSSMDSVARRKNATRETTNTLKAWLYEHRKNPYPTKGEKIMLAIITKMTLTQVSTWFANARRRLKKENKMTWEPRNKSGEATDQDDKDDGNCSSSSPAASDIVQGKKSSRDDNSMNGCHDDDSGDLRVKSELSSNPVDDRTKIPDFGSCSVKTESTGLPTAGCLTASSMGQYHGPNAQRMFGSSPNAPNFRSQSPISPGNCMPLLPSERIHSVHHGYHHQYEDASRYLHKHYHHPHQQQQHHHHQQPQHHRPGSPCSTMCDVTGHMNMDERPKIWSLAHTATSDSPPNLKRSESLTQIMPVPTATEEYGLNCGSPKEPSAPVAPGSETYAACSGRLASHHPSDAAEVVRRTNAWMNGDSGAMNTRLDCAQEPQNVAVAGECDNSKGQQQQYGSCYNGPLRGAYAGMYDAGKCYPGAALTASSQPVFQSCLSPSSNCNQNYKTEHVVAPSPYMGGCGDVASASSSTASSPAGVTTRPRPTEVQQQPSCEYMQSLVPAPRKPAGYLDDEKSGAAGGMSAATLPDFEPCEMSRGKSVQPDKGDILVTENVTIATQPPPCLALIR